MKTQMLTLGSLVKIKDHIPGWATYELGSMAKTTLSPHDIGMILDAHASMFRLLINGDVVWTYAESVKAL